MVVKMKRIGIGNGEEVNHEILWKVMVVAVKEMRPAGSGEGEESNDCDNSNGDSEEYETLW